jgi:hypothetical protein
VLTADCSVGARKKRVRRLALVAAGGGAVAAATAMMASAFAAAKKPTVVMGGAMVSMPPHVPNDEPTRANEPSETLDPPESIPVVRGVTIREDSASARGFLTTEQVHRVVQAHSGALRACYAIEARRDPALRGGITAAWTIDPSGTVSNARLAGSTIHNAHLEGCVLRQVGAWHFPRERPTDRGELPVRLRVAAREVTRVHHPRAVAIRNDKRTALETLREER